jgi:hypothetical protein
MRDTVPQAPIALRDTPCLVEDLCIALRNVGVYDRELPDGANVRRYIAEVSAIKRELARRGIDAADRIAKLSQETGWRMDALLQDCLSFPARMPFVQEADGIRRSLRCWHCRTRERPIAVQISWCCNHCLMGFIHAVEERKPVDGIVLFRTYNPEARCTHADSETVLVAQGYSDTIYGHCVKCLEDELARRCFQARD